MRDFMWEEARARPSVCAFGPFELDLRAGELRREGRRIRLQEQPFQILRILLECPGEVVLREEIRTRLWPGDIVVEFDHSINAAVNRLREMLRDSADKPRYSKLLEGEVTVSFLQSARQYAGGRLR